MECELRTCGLCECPHCGLPTKHADRWGQRCAGHNPSRMQKNRRQKYRERLIADGVPTEEATARALEKFPPLCGTKGACNG